jgi:glutamine cyclotransferase
MMKRLHLTIVALALAMVVIVPLTYLALDSKPAPLDQTPILYTYRVVAEYPHNTSSFTQGLVFDSGIFYEGTGLYGSSTLQKVKVETGESLQRHFLPDEYFGEGIAVLDGRIFQLTWLEQTGFVYDKQSFALLEEFKYPSEGWGLTTDGERLIMSNGSDTLTFLDPTTFEIIGYVQVHDSNAPVKMLNELEFIKGDVYANIWLEDKIAVIDVKTGLVKAWIDLEGIYTPQTSDPNDVLNGIAYGPAGERLFVTGKRWSKLFEIDIIPT